MVAEPEKFDRNELEAWLREQPPEVSVAIAARCALRVLPFVEPAIGFTDAPAAALLPVYRASSLAFTYSQGSEYTNNRLTNAAFALAAAARASNIPNAAAAHAAVATANAATGTARSANASFANPNAATAAADAAANAVAADTSAYPANAVALASDRQYIESSKAVEELTISPLWPDRAIPDELPKSWEELKTQLRSLDEDWDVWTQWYEDRLAGRPPEDEALAVARVTLPEPMWREGPKLVNATIRELIELYNKGGPEMLEARMAELREQYQEDTEDKETTAPDAQSSEVTPEDVGLLRENLDPEEIGPRFGRFVRQKRNEADLSQFQLALKAFGDEKRQAAISGIETGKVRRPTAETVRAIAQALELTDEDLAPFRDLLGTGRPETPAGEASEAEQTERTADTLPNAWILQYNAKDWEDAPQRIAQGTLETWKTKGGLPRALQPNDPVIYWRTTNDGGFVGTGHVLSRDLGPKDEEGWRRFPTEVHEFDQSRLIPRKEIIEAAGITRKSWQGAVLPLSEEEAVKIDDLLRREGRMPLFTDAQLEQARLKTREEQKETEQTSATDSDDATKGPLPEGEIRVRRDDAERDHDALGRGALAVSLATILHEIWCIEQGLKPYKARAPQKDAAGFVAHIDAPWGGGKTSFANLIARTLNPELDGPGTRPDFLENLYPDRKDMSGLFLSGDKLDPQHPGTFESRYDRAARRPWIIVPFNAWLNQHVDPPWWSFYQTIRKACFSAIRKEGCPDIVFNGDGPYEMRRESWLNRFDRLRGLWVRELWWRLTTPKVSKQLAVTLISIVVGLLLYKVGLAGQISGKAAITTTSGIGLVIALITGAGSFISAGITVLADALAPGRNALGERVSLGSVDPLARFRQHFSDMMEAIERPVLVIIDDIDRCEPKFIVEMTRGLQTILKSPRVVYLLLGDKNWIEQAFEVCHKDMKQINVGPEHTFGGRFVEKAIQLSYVLPDMGEKLEDYVSTVLIGRVAQQQEADAAEEPQEEDGSEAAVVGQSPEDQGKPEQKERREATRAEPEIDPELLRSITDTISKGHTLEDIDRLASATIDNIRQSTPTANRKEAERAVRDAVILQRSTRREAVEEAIRHRLQPIGHFLPGNPRHIKRIINAISMYQNSLVAFEAQQEDRKVGGKRWRQLVVGVVLMIGYPKSWGILARNPDWAAHLLAGISELPGRKGTGGEVDEDYASLVRNTVFATLLKDAKLTDENGAPVKTQIDTDAVEWLNKIVPVAGG